MIRVNMQFDNEKDFKVFNDLCSDLYQARIIEHPWEVNVTYNDKTNTPEESAQQAVERYRIERQIEMNKERVEEMKHVVHPPIIEKKTWQDGWDGVSK